MSEFSTLSELEHDLLCELFNVGVGRAAASLAQMVKQEVIMSVPEVELKTRIEMAFALGKDRTICSVSQDMTGPFSAKSILFFPQESSFQVVRCMLNAPMSDDMIAELQQEALSEIGNIVLSACIGAMASAMGDDFKLDLPEFSVSTPMELLQVNQNELDDTVLLIKISMTLADSDITGYLAFLLSNISFKNLKTALDKIIRQVSVPA